MTLQEKLIFLADRAKDGKEFYIVGTEKSRGVYAIKEGKLYCLCPERESVLTLNRMTEREFKLKPQWSFTDDEKAILRNLPEEFKWVVRDKDGDFKMYNSKPRKINAGWGISNGRFEVVYLRHFGHIFQSIRYEDTEPCEFRQYI